MDFLLKIVICSLCLQFALCNLDTYKAAIVDVSHDHAVDKYAPLIYDAAKMDADILVLPPPEFSRSESQQDICIVDKYDEIVQSISDAVKRVRLYVVAHLFEKIHYQDRQVVVKNNLVFNRDGSVISVYRKPVQGSANCNITNTNSGIFTTDFGVTFGLLMEEDLVLKSPEDLQGVKNFVLTGKSSTNVPFLSANQFSSSWSYTTKANLVSSKGIFAGRSGLKTGSGRVIVAELLKDGGEEKPTINFNGPSPLTNFPGEDLSQYTVRPLDVEAGVIGLHGTVCHNQFCCDFQLKTSFLGVPKEVNYGLVAFDGVQHYDRRHSIGVQSCAVIACAGLYKRSCFVGSENSTNIVFDKLHISGTFAKNSAQFPIIQSSTETTFDTKNFAIIEEPNRVTAKIHNTKDVLRFGIYSRNYGRDFESGFNGNTNKTELFSDMSEYISSENVQEFFDYVWIRLRVVIFVVSIYILEMM